MPRARSGVSYIIALEKNVNVTSSLDSQATLSVLISTRELFRHSDMHEGCTMAVTTELSLTRRHDMNFTVCR
jgi:hypothetical protein